MGDAMNRLLDWINERRIAVAKWRMLAHERGMRRAADQMARLIGQRSAGQVERMETRMGLR